MRSSLVLLLLVACETGTASRAQDPAAAEAVVKDYFKGVAARDCATLQRLAGGGLAAQLEGRGCDTVLRAYVETGVALVAIEGSDADGRDPKARLVRARVSYDGKPPQRLIVRVAYTGAQWKVVTL